MPFPVLAAISAGSALYGAFKSGRGKRKNISAINARFRGQRPEGYTTAADEEQLGRQLATGTRTAVRSGTMGQAAVARQARTRGLSGASAAALQLGVSQQVAEGRQAAAEGVAGSRYGMYANNLNFEREKMFRDWGAEIGSAQQDNARLDAQNATMWNSILEAAPTIAGMFSAPAATTAVPSGARPAAQSTPAFTALNRPSGYSRARTTYNPSVALPRNAWAR